jgi:hypothetical protein
MPDNHPRRPGEQGKGRRCRRPKRLTPCLSAWSPFPAATTMHAPFQDSSHRSARLTPRCSRIGQDRSPRSQLPITHASRLGEDLTSEISFTIPRSRCSNRVFGFVKFRNVESGQNKWTAQRQKRDGPCAKLVWEMQARGSQRSAFQTVPPNALRAVLRLCGQVRSRDAIRCCR